MNISHLAPIFGNRNNNNKPTLLGTAAFTASDLTAEIMAHSSQTRIVGKEIIMIMPI